MEPALDDSCDDLLAESDLDAPDDSSCDDSSSSDRDDSSCDEPPSEDPCAENDEDDEVAVSSCADETRAAGSDDGEDCGEEGGHAGGHEGDDACGDTLSAVSDDDPGPPTGAGEVRAASELPDPGAVAPLIPVDVPVPPR